MLLPTTLVLCSCILLPLATARTTIITGTTETCTTTAEFLTNPSFDTGSLTPWKVLTGFGSASVVEDTADDRDYVATLAEGYSMSAVYQTVTGLNVGSSYSLSYDYMIKSATRPGIAAFYLCVDGVASANRLTLKALSYTAAGTPWESISATFTPTRDTHEFYILVYVTTSSTDPEIFLDNAQFLAVSQENDLETCTTSTYTSTLTIPTSSSSIIPSIAVSVSSLSATATISYFIFKLGHYQYTSFFSRIKPSSDQVQSLVGLIKFQRFSTISADILFRNTIIHRDSISSIYTLSTANSVVLSTILNRYYPSIHCSNN
ncbi:hypothetical protein ASPCADRAFT_131482 [Aspergillus carbonarius ITEM 5010]|uniref:CBM-cenC domain-containing protein n=1 Tax=Aspergillus carbonarius (strain ITEM 5010) TaxID=602072 RepID=A0A1R3RKB1_ASPC5|nr:hypothetical protein ASPCADRAFT_131482 [Aspergillus carbonarius ITEM 5010]